MKIYSNKALSLLLALLTLSALFASCGGSDTASDTTAANTGDVSDTSDVKTEPQNPLDELDEADFNGEDFVFLVNDTGYFAAYDLVVEKMDGELINDSIYQRNSIIQERYNVKIAEHRTDTVPAELTKAITAGDDSYDASFVNNKSSALAKEGHFLDFNDIPNIDPTASWWDSDIYRDYAMGGRSYFMTGDISLMDDDCALMIQFNKYIMDQLGEDYPYELVNNMEWTWDIFNEMSAKAYLDINGNGETDQEDRYGLTYANDHIKYYYQGFGIRFSTVSTEENPIPEIIRPDDRSVSAVEKMMSFFNSKTLGFSLNKLNSGDMIPHTYSRVQFVNDQYLFAISSPITFSEFRDMEHDFGFLPFPTFDESQERYYTPIDTAVTMLIVPVTNTNIENTGLLLEAMAIQSGITIKPNYYETLLKRKYSRDDESEKMLDIIMTQRTYDLVFVYNWGGLQNILTNLVISGSNDFVSRYESLIGAAEAEVEKSFG